MNKSPFDPPSPPNSPAGKAAPSQGGLRLAPFWKRSMEDASTEAAGEPFDALADLFLGEIGPRGGAAGKTDRSALSSAAEMRSAEDDVPRLRLAGTEDAGHAYPVEPVVSRAASQADPPRSGSLVS